MDLLDLFAKISIDTSEYESGVESAEEKADGFASKLGGGLKTAGKVVAGAMAATTTAVTVVGGAMIDNAKKTAEYGDTVDKQSQKLGVSAKAYQEWDYIMNLAGTSMGNMGTGLKTLTNKLDDAKNGSDDAKEMFKKLGISMEDLSSMSREDIFEAAIKGFQGMEDSTERAALANDLFGKSGQELTPLFNMTAEATEEAIKQVNELGGIMSDDSVKASADFEDALTAMNAGLDGFKNSIGADVLPILTNLINFVTDNLPSIREHFSEVFDKISSGVEKAAKWVFDHFDDIKNTIETVVTVASDLLSTAWDACQVIFGALGDAFKTIRDALGETGIDWSAVWEGIKKVITVAGTIIAEAIKTAAKVIASIIKTVQEVYKGFKENFDKIKTTVTTVIDNVKETIKNGITSAKETISSVLDSIKEKFTNIFDTVKNIVTTAIDAVKKAFNFSWKLPELKLPHISVTGGEAPFGLGGKGSLPKFSIQWYAKAMDNAFMFTSPTVLDTASGLKGFGEAGAEIVLGRDKLLGMIQEAQDIGMAAVHEELHSIYSLMARYFPDFAEPKPIQVDGLGGSKMARNVNYELRKQQIREQMGVV